ncbi:hypothetical protein AB7C87_01870 [Natrarchaeobius sp. A-rgal3]|uniref:hypothetical protein n=1 Tax=Natrarchaeobius versutus TaxID=1679078 RepID=UPI00350ED466
MTVFEMAYIRTSTEEFFEIISYDLFLTGIGFTVTGTLTHFSDSPLTAEMGAAGSFLILLALLFWRVQKSVTKRESQLTDQHTQSVTEQNRN